MDQAKSKQSLQNGRITLVSFGFKYGMPENCDMVFDARMLRNPFWVPKLRHLDGTNSVIRDYVFEDVHTLPLCQKITDLVLFSLPLYQPIPDRNTIVGIGCTGGRHRSVSVVNEIARRLSDDGYDVSIEHRDIGKDTAEANGEEP